MRRKPGLEGERRADGGIPPAPRGDDEMDQNKGVAAALNRSSGRATDAMSQIDEILLGTMESGDYFAFSLLVCILKAQFDYMWDLVSKHVPEGTLKNIEPIAKAMHEETSRKVEREATELLKAGRRIWD